MILKFFLLCALPSNRENKQNAASLLIRPFVPYSAVGRQRNEDKTQNTAPVLREIKVRLCFSFPTRGVKWFTSRLSFSLKDFFHEVAKSPSSPLLPRAITLRDFRAERKKVWCRKQTQKGSNFGTALM